MEKHLYSRFSTIVSTLAVGLLSFSSLAQAIGPIVPFANREAISVRGDMAVTGNSILGVRGLFGGNTFDPNETFDTGDSNGNTNFDFVRTDGNGFIITDVNGDFIFDPVNNYTRAYIDIDSDPAFASRFNPDLLSATSPSQVEYGGNLNSDGNGSPATPSNEGTFSSSGADLNINPTCGVVQRAFLYWSGVYPSETINQFENTEFTNFFGTVIARELNPGASNEPRTQFCGTNCVDYTEIKILPPGGDQYYNISIDPASAPANPNGVQLQSEVIVDGLGTSPFNRSLGDLTDFPYVCVADVTDLFTSLQSRGEAVSGFWTVGNVRATTGYRSGRPVDSNGQGLAGGWTLAVIYEENVSTATEKEISFFDGYTAIVVGEDPVSVDIPSFNTVPEGPVNAWLASASLEGDRPFTGDQFSIQTQTTTIASGTGVDGNNLPLAARPLRENSTPDNTTNFFNSTITDLAGTPDFRAPNSSNTLGYDSDHYVLNNTNNSILNNGANGGVTDTTARLWLSTDGDNYATFFTAFAVEIIAPNVQVTKTAFDRFGNELAGNAEIDFEDQLTYELEVRNIGNDVATNIVLEDFLPVNTVIIPGVTQITSNDFTINETITPNVTSTDRNTGLDFSTTLITIPIPDLTPLGDCPPGDPNCRTQVRITLENIGVVEECNVTRNACIDRIENVALTSFQGIINPRPVDQRDSFFRFIDGCDDVQQGPTVTLTNRVGQCESQQAIICVDDLDLTAGAGFNTYEWFRINNPTDRNGNGIIDDADYAVDTDADDRISRAELEAQGAVFVAETSSQVASPTDPGPNQLRVNRTDLLDDPATPGAKLPALYIVIQEAPNPCLQGLESFEVNVFNPLDADNNPLLDGSGTPIENGTIITPQCSIRNDLQIVQFIVCGDGSGGANDSLTIPIPSGYPNASSPGELDTTIVLSRYDEGSCTRDENSCPFISSPQFGTCNYTEVINSTASALSDITISQTGSYRLEATIPGGCPITVFLNVVILRSNVDVIVPATGICQNTGNIEVTGLPTLIDIPNRANTTELLYELRFYENTGGTFDEATATAVLVQNPLANNGEAGFFADSSTYGQYTVTRPAGAGEQTIEVIVRAEPIITGSIGATATAPSNCPDLLRDTVTFLDAEVTEFRFLREPTCGFDDPITSFDDTTGDIVIEVTPGSPQYEFQLINTNGTATTADDVVQTSIGPTTSNREVFNGVNAGVNYKVRVFTNGEDPTTISVTNPLPAGNNCLVETEDIRTAPVQNIEATIEIVKPLTCDPAQLRVTLSVPGDPMADLSMARFEINELSTVGGTGIGRLTHLLIDDISNQPPPADPNNPSGPNTSPTTSTSIIYADLNSITNFTVQVNGNPSCTNPSSIPNSLELFEGLKIEESTVINVRCNGEQNGSFTVEAFEDTAANNPYVSPLADASTPTEIVYEVTNATPIDSSVTIDPNLLDRQPSPIFSGLPAGEYVVRAIDITGVQTPLTAGDPCLDAESSRPNIDTDNNGLTDCEEASGIDDSRTPTVAFPLIGECPSEEITITIAEPVALVAPSLIETQPTCEPFMVSEITIEDLATITATPDSFGGTQEATFDYTFTLFNTQGTVDLSDDTNAGALQGSNNLPFTGVAAGTYRLEIEDANGCTVNSSNEVTINPTAIVTFGAFTDPILDCDPATTDVTEISATITVNATAVEDDATNATPNSVAIEGYRIIEINGVELDNTTTPALVNDFTTNPSGNFADLEPGDYVIEASTVGSSCRATLPVTIAPLNRIEVTTPNPTNVVCFGETNGQVSFSVSRFDTTDGFRYTLTRSGLTTPVQENAGPLTSTLPITLTGLDANDLVDTTDEYTLTVTDLGTSCFEAQPFRILEPASLPSFTRGDLSFDCVSNMYEFTVTPAGGSGTGYEFSLDNFTNIEDDNIIMVAPGATYTVSLRDSAGCMAMPALPETAPTPVPLTAALNSSASNLCLPNTVGNPISIVLDVTGTNDFRYRLTTETTFTDVTASVTVSGDQQITIDNPPTIPGIYTYVVLDDNFDEESCGETVEVIINEPITTSTPTRPTLVCDATTGNLPTSGEFIEFTTSGGTGTYLYTITEIVSGVPDASTTFTTDATPTAVNTIGITTVAPSTNTTPRIQFAPSENGKTFQIEVSDSAVPACNLPTSIEFTVNYPVPPVIDSVTATTIDCFGDDAVITITPVITGSQTLNDFEYSFDDGTTFQRGNSATVNLGTNLSQTFNTRIRNVITGCVSINDDPVDDILVNQPTAIVENDPMSRVITQVTCTPTADPSMPSFSLGSFETTFNGGVTANTSTPSMARSGFTFQLFDNNDISRGILQQQDNQTARTITFGNLDIGEYSVVIIDANGCRNQDPIIFNINPTPEIEIIDSFFDPISCAGGVDLYFEVRGGSPGPGAADLFRIGNIIGGMTINPAAPGDNIQKFGNTDFPLSEPLPPGASGFDPDRLFRIRGIDFNTPIDIFIEDSATGCSSSIQRFTSPLGTPPVDFINVTPTNTGACNNDSGAIDVTFDVIEAASVGEDFEVDVFRVFDNELLTPSPVIITNTAATGNVVPQITGLPSGELRVRVRQVSGGSVCSNSQVFNIGIAPPLTGPFEVNNLAANCDSGARFEVRSQGGTPDYAYRLVRVGDPAPVTTSNFPLSNTFEIDPTDPIITLGTFPGNKIGEVDVYVQDFNGCISGPLTLDVREDPSPILTIDALGMQECGAGPFTVNLTVTNFDSNQTYTSAINGQPAQPLMLTETASNSGIATGNILNITTRGNFDVVVVGSAQPTCTTLDSFTIFEQLVVDIQLSEPNCSPNLDRAEITVNGGFESVATRSLVYELFEGTNTTPIATTTSTSTNIEFETGTAGVTLIAGNDYRVVVTDRFDSTANTIRSCTAEDTDNQRAIQLPIIEVATTNLTCPDDAEGVITISRSVNGDTPPINFELYEFANTVDAEAAIAAGTVRTTGTPIAVTAGNSTFENLRGESQAVYVPLAIATANNCEVLLPGATDADRVVSLTEPIRSVEADFRVTPTNGVCNNIDPMLNSSASIRIEVLGTAPIANYTFTIPGRITDAPITGGDVSIEVDSNPSSAITYDVIISDGTLTTCNPITIQATVDACPEPIIPPDPLIVGNPTAVGVSCFGDTNGSVTINIGPANGRTTVNYTYSITGGTPSITRNSPVAGTTNPLITETGLNPGNYSLTITDLDEPTSAAIVLPNYFQISTPTSLPDFTIETPLPYNCSNNTVSITANAVVNSGTPGYIFELDDPATVTDPDFTSTSGEFINVPAPAVGSGATINYEVTIIDANNCTFSRTIDVNEQPQLRATVSVPNRCLPNGTTTNDVSVRVDITSGTAPFEFARVERVLQTDPVPPSPTTFTTVAGNANFFEDATIQNEGIYNYYLRDANGCVFVTPDVVIFAPITLAGVPVLTPPTCDITSTTTPQARTVATYEFDVNGGNTSVPYTIEIREGASATTLGTFTTYTGNFPILGADAFMINQTQDGRFFQFKVTDAEGCSLFVDVPPVSFPDSPSATATNPVYFCDGETGTAVVTVTGGTPPYSYSYNGGAFVINENTFTSTAGTFDYTVRDANNCTFSSTLSIEDNSIENDGDPRITNISCSLGMPATNSGAISIDIIGGTAPYEFTIISQSTGNPVPTAVQTPANPITQTSPFTVTFSDLEADIYNIQVTDANNCTVREFADLEVETISPIDISTPIFIDECEMGGTNSGITVVFSIDGAVGPFTIRSFTESLAAGNDVFVVPSDPPSAPTIIDDVSRFGDANFPASFTFPAGTPASVTSTFYAVSNLNYGQSVTIEVIDANTSCPQNTNFTTPDSGLVEITLGAQLPESECASSPDDGEQELTFQRLSGATTDYDVMLLDPATGAVINIPGLSPQVVVVDATGLGTPLPFTGLDAGNYQVRVTERRGGVSTLCGATEDFTTTQAVILGAPTVNSSVIVDCNSDPSTFTINVSATGGRLPYSFIARLATDPVSTAADFIAVGVPGPTVAVDFSTGLDWVLDVMDNSICGIVSTPFTITEQPDPILNIDPNFSVDQCDGENRFRIGVTVTNYDPAFAPYTFRVGTTGGTLVAQTLVNTSDPTLVGPFTGELEVSTRGTFDIEVANSNGCDDLEMITIFPELEIVATLPEAINCDGEIPTISATVTGGFGSGTLIYDLVNAGLSETDPNFILNTLTSTTGTITFTSNTAEGSTGTPVINTGIDYAIRVTDPFGATSGAPSCSSISNTVNQPVLQRTELIAPTITEPTCNGFTDGSVRINFNSLNTGDDPIFELYEFADLATAQNAVTNINNETIGDPTIGGGTLVTTINASDAQLFESLGAGFFADFVSNSTNRTLVPNCYIGNTAFEITEPAAFDLTGITVSPIQPRCDGPSQSAQLTLSIDLSSTTGTAPYFYRLDSLSPFIEIVGTDSTVTPAPIVTLNIDVAEGTTFNVEFRDSGNISCFGNNFPTALPVTINTLLNPVAQVSLDTTQPNGGNYSCTNDEAIIVALTNAEEATDYTFEIISQPATSTLSTAIQTVSSSGVSPAPIEANLPYSLAVPGNYEFEITNFSTGCSTTVEYEFDEVEQLSIQIIPLAELNCEGDDAMVSFEVLNYSGFLRYTIVNDDATPIVLEDAIIDTNTGAITPITPASPNPQASFDPATNILTSAVAFGVDNYSITVVATNDAVPNITSTNTLCTFTQATAIVGPTVPLTVDSAEGTSLTCTQPTSTITATASGGTFPYTFTLEGGSPAITPIVNQTGIFTNIAAGDYTVAVVDVNGCTTGVAPRVVPTIEEVEPLPIFEITAAPVLCAEDDTSITVSISGTETVTDASRIDSRSYSLIEVDNLAEDNPSAPLITISQSLNIEFIDVRPGVNGTPRFFRVDIIDNFGCTTSSNIIDVEAPMETTASNTQIIAIDCQTNRPGQAGLETAQFEISITGGIPPYTYTRAASSFAGNAMPTPIVGGEVGGPTEILGSPNTGSQLYELRPGRHFFRIVDSNGCEAFTQVDVGAAPQPIEFNLMSSTDPLCPTVLGFVDIDGPILGGSGSPVFELWVVDGTNEVQINDSAPIASVSNVTGSSLFTGLPDVRINPPAGISGATATYEYRVSTGSGDAMCPTVNQQFNITQFPPLIFSAESTNVSCEFEEDATITVNLKQGLAAGEYTITLQGEQGIDRSDANFADGIVQNLNLTPEEIDSGLSPVVLSFSLQANLNAGAVNSVTFENLGEGDYLLSINTPTGCRIAPSFVTIDKKQPFTAVFEPLGSTQPDCSTDAAGTRTYTLEGGAPPYYYAVINLDDSEEQPNVEDIFGVATNRVGFSTIVSTVTTGGITSGGTVSGSIGSRGTITGGVTNGGISLISRITPDGITESTVTQITESCVIGGITTGILMMDPNNAGQVIIQNGTTAGGNALGSVSTTRIGTGLTSSADDTVVIRATVGNHNSNTGGVTTGGTFIEITTVNQSNTEPITTARVVELTAGATVTGGTLMEGVVVGGNLNGGNTLESNLVVETVLEAGSGLPVDITITGPNPGEVFENNVNYQIFFVDSGNGMIAPNSSTTDIVAQADFNACEAESTAFNFEVPDLTGFTIQERYDCISGLYDITVILPANSTLVRDRITYYIFNQTTGIITPPSRGNSTLTGVSPGEIVVTIDYRIPDGDDEDNNDTICNSSGPDGMVSLTLADIPSLSFVSQVVLDENNNPILDQNGNNTGLAFELVGLNEYRISAQGGLAPYTFEVTNVQGEALDLEIDLRGRATFEITESGIYSFTVTDANGCSVSESENVIGLIDIEIPNVFNPSSSNPEVNVWYPDNLTFGDVFPIPDGGIVVDEGSTVITLTIGGTTTGGTVRTNNDGTITIEGGTTTGGIILVTTINPDGETSSTVTVNTGGTLVGGTRTGTPSTDSEGNTIIVGGTTTGGTPTGGTTSAPAPTGITSTPTSTTVIRTTVGNPTTNSAGETTGGIVVETTTMPGPNNTTVTTVRIIDQTTTGTVTGGTINGSIVIGGTISGGTITETGLPVATTTSGGTTINRDDDFIDFRNIDVMVFDRYGRLLKQFKGILDRSSGEGWDGTYQGKPMPTGDYWYLIKLNDSRGREISGNFTLYRSK